VPAEIEVVLFDIGGVLADFHGLAAMAELSGSDSVDATAARWLLSPWVRSFEAGRCGEEEFALGVIEEWSLPYTAAQFLELFLGWLHEPFPGAERLVRETAERITVGCLSNTNALHWLRKAVHWPLTGCFEHTLLSYQLGLVKPDLAIFELAATRCGVAPRAVLFLDDNVLNVEGARAAGLVSEQTRGPDEARAVLRRYELAD
jgi:glucose-1-phosphatase